MSPNTNGPTSKNTFNFGASSPASQGRKRSKRKRKRNDDIDAE